MTSRFLAIVLLSLAPFAACAESAPAPPPIKAFFHRPALAGARLSPSGQWLAAAVSGSDDRVRLAVIDLSGKSEPVIVAAYADADVRSFDWVNDERLIYNVVDFQVGNMEQNFGPGLFAVRRDGSERRELIYARQSMVTAARTSGVPPLSWNHQLRFVPRDGGNDVVVGELHFDGVGDFIGETPMRLDVTTGRARSIGAGAPAHARDWRFDPKGEPRVAVTQWNGQQEVFWRDSATSSWRSLARAPEDNLPLYPVEVDGDGQLFVKAGRFGMTRFDFATNRPEPTPIVSTPGFDFDGTILTDEGSRALGVRLDTDAQTTIWFDPALKQLQQLADARFPGHINALTCRRCKSDGVLLVYSYSDQDPGSYWLYRPATGAWEPVGKTRSDIDPKQMAQMDFFRIKARDGDDLPVWVTKPAKTAAGSPPPAVVLVHGGPWVRGSFWQWNAEQQFLASRGYVVIEPEFRGSTGFGERHFKRGFKQWGGTMQDDVADAVRWAAAKGLVDGKRVCLAGASYGGYATLMGLIRYPDLYRCGIAWVAVTDPRLLFEESWASDSSAETRRYTMPTRIGDPKTDADLIKAATPVAHAAEIRAPLFMAFGREDRRVPLEHGTSMRDAMHAAGHDPEFVVYDGEGHGFMRLDHQIDFWTRAERFLDKNLR